MLQKIWNWLLILLTAVYFPLTVYEPANTVYNENYTVSYTDILEFLDTFAEPSACLSLTPYGGREMLADIITKAFKITEGCSGDYDKIKAVCMYVSDNTYYDYRFLEGIEFRSQAPLDVFNSQIGVCQGYSDLVTVMLRGLDIPCVTATSRTHAYNFAYDGSRWIFFDSTWCSANIYSVQCEKLYSGCFETYFDLTQEEIDCLGVSHQTAKIVCEGISFEFYPESQTAEVLF